MEVIVIKQLRLLIITSLMILTACGTTIVQVVNTKGIQEPTGEFIGQSVSTKIKIICHGTRKVEMSEESIYPQYFPLEKKQSIFTAKTEKIYIELYVENPKKVKYTLIKIIRVCKHKTIIKEIYSGNKIQKVFQLQGPMNFRDEVVNLGFEIYVEGHDFPIFRKSCSYIVNPDTLFQ